MMETQIEKKIKRKKNCGSKIIESQMKINNVGLCLSHRLLVDSAVTERSIAEGQTNCRKRDCQQLLKHGLVDGRKEDVCLTNTPRSYFALSSRRSSTRDGKHPLGTNTSYECKTGGSRMTVVQDTILKSRNESTQTESQRVKFPLLE